MVGFFEIARLAFMTNMHMYNEAICRVENSCTHITGLY